MGRRFDYLFQRVVGLDLDSSRTALSNEDIARLRRTGALRELYVEVAQGAGLPNLGSAGNLDRLELLYLARTPHSEEPSDWTVLSEESAEWIGGLKKLKKLVVRDFAISENGLRSVSQLSNLEVLMLGGEGITDRMLIHLASLKRLRSLTLWGGAHIDGPGLAVLQGLPALEELHLGDTDVSANSLELLARIPSLKTVHLPGTIGWRERRNLRRLKPGLWCGVFADDNGE